MSKIIQNSANKVNTLTLNGRIKPLDSFLAFFYLNMKFDYEKFGLVLATQNTIPTRIRCPKCCQRRNFNRPRVFKTTQNLMKHLSSPITHNIDRLEFPTIEQSAKLIETHSLLLQLRVIGEKI